MARGLILGSTLGALLAAACVVRNEGACTSDDVCDEGEVCRYTDPESSVGECVPAGDDGGGTGDHGGDGADPPDGSGGEEEVALGVNRDVDILLVVDNSGSMGEEQGRLARSLPAFLDALEGHSVEINYRIGITTTDNGNPWCDGTTPEGGGLRLSSCLSRLEEFVFQGGIIPTDKALEACESACTHDSIEITPTTTEVEDKLAPRPWVERTEGVTNLADSVTMVQALRCFVPQGINGCGFESHMEAMYKGLKRTEESKEASHGFLRQDAVLAVLFVTDEVDCSYRNDDIFLHPSPFMPPDAIYPTSAVCWNAGVACTGGPGTYDECHAQDKAEDTEPTGPSDAVLHPIGRYVDLLQEIENQKKMASPGREVLISVIGGVPEGYAKGEDIVYQDAQDPYFQHDFGIGPGCTGVATDAVPPVRMREFAEAFMVEDERNLFSVCAEDYSESLAAIGRAIAGQIKPSCVPVCVQEGADCTLVQVAPGEEPSTTIPQCDVDLNAGTWDFPGVGDRVCYRMLTDTDGSTSTGLDDMSGTCMDEGWNLELVIERRSGFPAPPGTVVRATCKLSQNPQQDCPSLP